MGFDSIAVLILAGGENSAEMRAVSENAPCRAMIPLNGRLMVEHIASAICSGMEQAGIIGRILVAGDTVPALPGCIPVSSGATMVDTLLCGIAALQPQEKRLLVATADIPFLTAKAVADFLQRAESVGDADFIYPIVSASVCRAEFPDLPRTTLRIAEGEFTGGNLVILNPQFLEENSTLLRDAYARRKQVVSLARLLGFGTLTRLALSRLFPQLLTLNYLESAVSRTIGGVRARAVISPFAEIAVDLDQPDDIAVALKRFVLPPGR